MDEIKRLQELAGINEIKVNKPVSKKELYDFFENNHFHLLISLSQSYTLEKLIEGYDNIEEYLRIEWGYEQDIIPSLINNIQNYYKIFAPNEIDARYLSEHDDFNDSNNNKYKNISIGNGDGDWFVFRHNL